jgi:rubrerythrin
MRPDATLPQQVQQSLLKALQGEYDAIIGYEKLAVMAPNESIRKKILEIRDDEKRHYQMFLYLLKNWYGQDFHPNPAKTPSSYKEGLLTSIIDEQETVDAYLDLADQVNDPHAKKLIARAAADEQNHAVWFLLFYTLAQ